MASASGEVRSANTFVGADRHEVVDPLRRVPMPVLCDLPSAMSNFRSIQVE